MSKERGLLPLLLGVSALGVALVLGGVYIFSRYLVKQTTEASALLRTSPRDLPRSVDRLDPATVYPTCQRVEDSEEKIAVEVPVHGSYQVVSGDYLTDDSLEEVTAYYRHLFKGQVTERLEPGGAHWVHK